MNATKVLILITKANWGGAQRYVFDLATHLPKDNFKVEVMAGGDGPLIDKLWEAGISTHGDLGLGRDVNIWEDIKAFFSLIKIIRDKKPDVLHLNSSKIGGLGALAGRLARVKRIIFTVHGWAFNENRPFLEKIFIRLAYWMTIFMAHQTIAVSRKTKEQAENWPLIKGKITVIHNGIGSETPFSKINSRYELTTMNSELKRVIGNAEEKNTTWIGAIGELHKIKGYEYALKAIRGCAEELKRTHPRHKIIYVICGDGEERENLETLIDKYELKESVFLMGHVNNASQYLKAFDIFLLASLSEGLSYVILEAGAAQLAVVATAVGGIPEVIEDMKSGILVQPKNPRELAHAISFVIEHADERRKYATTLKERVANDFSLKKMLELTEKAYMPISVPRTRS